MKKHIINKYSLMKKYIINKYSLIAAVCLTLLFSSCKEDLFDSIPYGEATSDQFWRNGEDAVAAANAMYEYTFHINVYGHHENVFDNCSDDIYRSGDNGWQPAMENFTLDASNGGVAAGWKAKYEIIQRANAVLINVPGIEDIDETLKNRILGEAYFLRAFTYWRFSVIYGGVPLLLEQNTIENNFNVAKSTQAEVRAQIESDLIAAVGLLPASHSGGDIGRAHQGSANALLAKLYLYQEKFDDVITTGGKVISGPYPLAANFRDNFTRDTENNPEVLFAAQAGNWDFAVGIAMIYPVPRAWGGWDHQNPTQNVVDEFEAGDIRKENTLWSPGDLVDRGPNGITEYTADLSATGYSFNKMTQFDDNGNIQGMNSVILRTADVLLMVAEAKIRKSGAGAGDTEINAVRVRTGLGPVSNADMPELIHERRVELLFENQRHQDLMRWDKAGLVDIVQIYGEDRGQFDPVRVFVKPKHYFFPIPQREIDFSNGVLIQNEGY